MIDIKDMDIEEYRNLLYDLSDNRVKYEDVIWHNQDSPIKNYLQKGDIVKVKNNYFVVVSANNDDDVFFMATVDAFVYTENSQMHTYSQTNSGCEYIKDNVKKVGHITLDGIA